MRYAKWEFHDGLYRLYLPNKRMVWRKSKVCSFGLCCGKKNTVDLHNLFYLILGLVLKWSSERRS